MGDVSGEPVYDDADDDELLVCLGLEVSLLIVLVCRPARLEMLYSQLKPRCRHLKQEGCSREHLTLAEAQQSQLSLSFGTVCLRRLVDSDAGIVCDWVVIGLSKISNRWL